MPLAAPAGQNNRWVTQYNAPSNDYAWWTGADGNIWANVNGDVQNLGRNGTSVEQKNGLVTGYSVPLWASNKISDPNPPARQEQNQEQIPKQPTAPADENKSTYDRNAVNYWNGVIEQNQNQLSGLNGLLGELNKSTDSDYDIKRNELQSAYDRSKADYESSTTRNQQQLQTNKNTIADRASQGLRGLLRTLGAMGAGGSSAALYNAPELVTAQANQERTGANQTFGENQQKLDTNWGNYKIDHENDRKKLEDWKAGQIRENEQKVLNQKNSLLQTLADAYAQRGSAGAGAGNKINELTAQMKSNQNRLNELNRFIAPQYDGMRANYQAPTLSSYNTGGSSLTTEVSNAPQAGMSANITPTLAMLLGIRDRKDSNPYARS